MTSSDVNFNIDNAISKNYIDWYSGCNSFFLIKLNLTLRLLKF